VGCCSCCSCRRCRGGGGGGGGGAALLLLLLMAAFRAQRSWRELVMGKDEEEEEWDADMEECNKDITGTGVIKQAVTKW